MQWRVIGQSVRGASHVRSKLPNQDAIQWYPESGGGPPLIVAVSDGHGSPKSFRSDIGSRFAVEQTVAVIQDLLSGQSEPTGPSTVKRTVEERVPREIVRRWQLAVDADLKNKPFTQEELEGVEAKQGTAARRKVEENPNLAYGATFLSILITNTFILYLQLGDGDILAVMDDNTVNRPVPGDERLFANQTTSLCTKDAWRDVRFRFQPLYGPQPAIILLSSDGYANSFVNDEAFLKVGTDILDIIRTDGVAAVADNLADWLRDASQAGSGDDITLGILYRADIPAKAAPKKTPVETPAPPPPTEKPTVDEVAKTAHANAKAEDEEQVEEKAATTVKPQIVHESPAANKTEEANEAPSPVTAEAVSSESPDKAEEEATPPPDASTEEASLKKRKRRIKDEEPGPHEPSKKLPSHFYED